MKIWKQELSQFGFSLIELIVSIALISIIAVSFLYLFTFGYREVSASGAVTSSNLAAQDIVDGFIAGSADVSLVPEISDITLIEQTSGTTWVTSGSVLSVQYQYGSSVRELVTFVAN